MVRGDKSVKREFVNYTLEDGIAIVTIDHPAVNSLDAQTRDELGNAFDELGKRTGEVRVVILTSAGEKIFVSGADIRMLRDRTPEDAITSGKTARGVYLKIEEFEVPIICAIKGFCLGGGMELAMCCDLRIAAEDSQFGQPEVNLGIIPGGGATQRLARLVGAGIAKELIYTGKRISAQEALSIGLLNKIVPLDKVLDEAKEMAELIASKGTLAIRAAKKAINGGLNMTLIEGLELETSLFSQLMGTEDKREGIAAFLEKRKPVFKGK